MRRTDKYPETRWFHYHNENPKGRITGDCAFRAIATATGMTWGMTVKDMADMSDRTGWAINDKKGIETYLAEQGWEKCKQPKKSDGTKYTGKEFCEMLNVVYGESKEPVIAIIGAHHITCIKKWGRHHISFRVFDIWDCTNRCVGNYWIKPKEKRA